jgi:hypothetical protein
VSSTDRGHARERRWVVVQENEGRCAFRPRWACVDVIVMEAGKPTYFDEVKTTTRSAFADFGPVKREALRDLAARAGAIARLVWWPPRAPLPIVIEIQDWPG